MKKLSFKSKYILFASVFVNIAISPNAFARPNVQRPMVVAAANPVAVDAGMAVLKKGGDAVDAAIAVQAMLGLVEPQSSGLGGGAFLLRYDAKTRKIEVYDGRETAPNAANDKMFLDIDGKPINRGVAMTSGRATGIPGVVAMLKLAHDEHGKLPWSQLFDDAAKRAEIGFIVGPRLDKFVHGNYPQNQMEDVKRYFTKSDGQLVQAGDILKNPEYSTTLRKIAKDGPSAIYKGEFALKISNKVAQNPIPAIITTNEIALYKPVKREPICANYRKYIFCTAPPPSSGVSLIQLLKILENTDIATRGPSDPISWFKFAEASRIMYADRDAWIGDSKFVSVPIKVLLDKNYIAQRRTLIGERIGTVPVAGSPSQNIKPKIDATSEPGGTSHFVINDAKGNIVSMTTTIESFFGSGRMVDGVFLNNQMTDFSFLPNGANSIAPSKRPRSSMSPIIILNKNGEAIGALGSPGGNAILAYIAKSIIGISDWNLSMQQAFDLPNLVAKGENFNGEVSKMDEKIVYELKEKGMNIKSGSGEDSGLHGFIWRNGKWDVGADKRREGTIAIEKQEVILNLNKKKNSAKKHK